MNRSEDMQGWILGLALALTATAFGCTRSNPPPGNSSETHFLQQCDDGADCGAGLACVCGVCTVSGDCDACSAMSAEAECEVPSPAGCATPRICDVVCESDADCTELGREHECSSGRCRAPDPQPVADAGPAECRCSRSDRCLDSGEHFIDECSDCWCEDSGLITCTDVDCSAPPCRPGFCEFAGLCVPNGRRFLPSQPDAAGCGFCTCTDAVMSCEGDCAALGEPSSCENESCRQHGICYPPGSTTEDGCCSCSDEGFFCIDPGWCTGMVPVIGEPCAVDGDCDRGLECRTDLFGERGLCTRDCNHGCPTGTECAASVPGYDGGTIPNLCLRPCETNADCPLGSRCDAPGDTTERYCY
jgi:hypothetical protein